MTIATSTIPKVSGLVNWVKSPKAISGLMNGVKSTFHDVSSFKYKILNIMYAESKGVSIWIYIAERRRGARSYNMY
jgi:hypothetical protein